MTIQPITLLGAGLCFAVLFFRYRNRPPDQRPSSPRQRLKTAKALAGALIALMAIGYTMRSLGAKLDNAPPHDPSLLERVVLYFSN